MELAGQWENPEPQAMVVNGKEIITTRSTLLCKAEGMLIEAVTSGQDKIVAERIALFLEVEEKYPGLLAILTDPYGSLYLQEGMYETALRFIEDRMECNGGEMWIPGLFNKEDLEGELVRAALERLLTDCDASSVNRFLEGLETTGVQYGMYDEVEGWETVTLNDKVMDMLKEDCKATAERIKTSSFARWVEENKRFVDLMADGATQLAYATVIYSSTLKQPIKGTGEDSLDKIDEKVKDQFKKGETGESTSASKIGSTSQKVQNLTKEDIINALDGVTEKSSEIADALRKEKIGINVLGDQLFEKYHGCGPSTVAIQVDEQIYVRSSSASLLSDVVHEGTHALDYYHGISQRTIGSWTGETAAYSAERLYQIKSGGSVEFANEEDMMVHIWQNYSRR